MTFRVRLVFLQVLTVLLVTSGGCIAFRSEIEGRYQPTATASDRPSLPPVRLLFVFRHYRMCHGADAVPKLRSYGVPSQIGPATVPPGDHDTLPNLYRNAIPEIENLESYATFTVTPQDYAIPARQELRRQLEKEADLILEMDFLEETRLVPQFLGALVSCGSLTLIPWCYGTTYSVKAKILNHAGDEIHATTRSARLRDWVQLLLLVAYPFHPRERKIEEIYLEFFRDVFRELNAEGAFDPGPAGRA